MNMPRGILVLLASVLGLAECMGGETVHRVRPGSQANIIALEVVNRTHNRLEDIDVEVNPNADWIAITGVSGRELLESGSSANAVIRFDVLPSAKMREEGEIFITLSSNGAFLAEKSISLIVAPPATYHLSQNYPNPFNPTTTIGYQLPLDGHVTLKVYDLLGREVTTLVSAPQTAGYHTVEFHAAHVASGVYFYRIHAGSFVATKRFVVMK